MWNSEGKTLNENNSGHCKTIFKQTLKFTKDIPEQKISPEGFLIRDCGCVMRFLPNLDNKLNKNKLQLTTISKNQNQKNISYTHHRNNLNQTKVISSEMYQSTFWMEPRIVPIKYTTELNFNLESPIRRFTETIDLQMKLVPCPYIQQIGTTKRFKTSIETKIQSECTLPLDTTI
ncbi:ACYPI008378 protein [Aphis craccivora]|uniref:ACYPI008378 protein n=1 Tax=Aphis craccivora TaxID=307492 RepID=A0A6G0Z116_APHCR|nr:ACYPI008378 protein [Aphis craccivora]